MNQASFNQELISRVNKTARTMVWEWVNVDGFQSVENDPTEIIQEMIYEAASYADEIVRDAVNNCEELPVYISADNEFEMLYKSYIEMVQNAVYDALYSFEN